ncbi:MAG: hypothetical protein KF722_06140 [Nitrospira sp.]|nr:hypothetical protein [Nitrospira sp.]
MTITSGPEQPSSRFLGSETGPLTRAGRRTRSTVGLLLVGSLLLACNAPLISDYPSVHLAPDRQAILVLPSDRTTPSRLPLQSLPTESTLAPGLFYHPQRFELVRVSPDGRYAAFSAAGHHNLIGLLDLATMTVREIDFLTEGDVAAFHWAADGRTLAYDYLPASGYHRVKGYDIGSGKGLVMPHTERNSATHVTFESWGSRPHEIILRITDGGSKELRTETVTLIPRR